METDNELLTGTVDKVVYRNKENGYTVCELDVGDTESITLVGILPFLSEGETIKALGSWETHSSYGRQFKVEYFEKQMPASEAAMLKYLSSNAVRGIGRKTAQRLLLELKEKVGAEAMLGTTLGR